MLCDEDARLAIGQLMENRNENVLIGVWVKVTNDDEDGWQELLLLVTESAAALCTGHRGAPGAVKNSTFHLLDITAVKSTVKGVITLGFARGRLVFQHPSSHVLLDRILEQVYSILTVEELPVLATDGFDGIGVLRRSRTDCGYKRFRARAFTMTPKVPEDLLTSYERVMATGSATFDFRNLIGLADEYTGALVDSLTVEAKVTSVIVPYVERSQWSDVAKYLTTTKCQRKFQILGKSEGMTALLDIGRWGSSIKTMSFGQADEADLRLIAEIYTKYWIEDVEVQGEGHSLSGICSFFKDVKTLKGLSVYGGIDDGDLDQCIDFISSLKSVSLKDCGIEISKFVNAAFKAPDFRVKNLDLSGNILMNPIDQGFDLPATVTSFKMVDTKRTTVPAFASVFKAVLRARAPVFLDFSRLPLDEDSTKALLDELSIKGSPRTGNRYFNVREFHWNENFGCPGLFDLLDRCAPLSVLSLNGVLSDSLATFAAEFLGNTRTVTDLRIQGTPKRKVSSALLGTIVGQLAPNRSVRCLDISDHILEGSFFVDLATTLTGNHVIEEIGLSKSEPIASGEISKLLYGLIGGKPLLIRASVADDPPEIRTLIETIASGGSYNSLPSVPITPPVVPLRRTYRQERSHLIAKIGDISQSQPPEIDAIPEIDNSDVIRWVMSELDVRRLTGSLT